MKKFFKFLKDYYKLLLDVSMFGVLFGVLLLFISSSDAGIYTMICSEVICIFGTLGKCLATNVASPEPQQVKEIQTE